jgi:hypothetical protein
MGHTTTYHFFTGFLPKTSHYSSCQRLKTTFSYSDKTHRFVQKKKKTKQNVGLDFVGHVYDLKKKKRELCPAGPRAWPSRL